jgi:hypothetical protein
VAKFKVGDIVRCVDDKNMEKFVVKGEIYTVMYSQDGFVGVCNGPKTTDAFPWRFVLVAQGTPQQDTETEQALKVFEFVKEHAVYLEIKSGLSNDEEAALRMLKRALTSAGLEVKRTVSVKVAPV